MTSADEAGWYPAETRKGPEQPTMSTKPLTDYQIATILALATCIEANGGASHADAGEVRPLLSRGLVTRVKEGSRAVSASRYELTSAGAAIVAAERKAREERAAVRRAARGDSAMIG